MKTEPTPNLPLLRKVTDWAEAEAAKPNGGLWDQSAWAWVTDCGTTFCLAGYACAVSVAGSEVVEIRESAWSTYVVLRVDGEDASWRDTAKEALGLTEAEAADLFDGYNDIGDVRRVAEDIAARGGERL